VGHQGLEIIPGNDADMADAGGGHIGKHEVDLAIPAAEGQGRHGALIGQFAHVAVAGVGDDNSHYRHDSLPP